MSDNKYITKPNNPEGVYGGTKIDVFGFLGDHIGGYLNDRINEIKQGPKSTIRQSTVNSDGSIGRQPYRSRKQALDLIQTKTKSKPQTPNH